MQKEIIENNRAKVSRDDLNAFLNDVSGAAAEGKLEGEDLPWVEADRSVIEHFNRGKMKDWENSLFFIYNDVKVYEKGKKDEADRMQYQTIEERNFGRSSQVTPNR